MHEYPAVRTPGVVQPEVERSERSLQTPRELIARRGPLAGRLPYDGLIARRGPLAGRLPYDVTERRSSSALNAAHDDKQSISLMYNSGY